MAVLISMSTLSRLICFDIFFVVAMCCNPGPCGVLAVIQAPASTHRLIDSSTRHHSLNWFDSIRFVDKAFVIRALHLRAPSATALLEETLQCSKCVCTRTVCVCVRDVNFTVYSIYLLRWVSKLRYHLKSQSADMMCQNSQVSAAGWRASTSRSIDGCPCRGLWWNLLNS